MSRLISIVVICMMVMTLFVCVNNESAWAKENKMFQVVTIQYTPHYNYLRFKVKNTGSDKAKVYITVKDVTHNKRIANGVQVTIGAKKTATKDIKCRMKSCKEKFNIKYTAKTKHLKGSSQVTRYRYINKKYIKKWTKATFPTVETSIEKHYTKHGKEVGAKNIAQYVEKALKYKGMIKKKGHLVGEYKDCGVKCYQFDFSGKYYIRMTKKNLGYGKIVTFGKRSK